MFDTNNTYMQGTDITSIFAALGSAVWHVVSFMRDIDTCQANPGEEYQYHDRGLMLGGTF